MSVDPGFSKKRILAAEQYEAEFRVDPLSKIRKKCKLLQDSCVGTSADTQESFRIPKGFSCIGSEKHSEYFVVSLSLFTEEIEK